MLRPAVLLVAALLAALVTASPAAAQELNCTVTVNRQQVSGPEYAFLDELQPEVDRYLNARAWTDDVYDPRERIECSVQIVLTQAVSLSQFAGQVAVQASRPIYGTPQRSRTLLLSDNAWTFSYTRGRALVYDPNRFDSLTSLLDFYAHIILGMDYDTFAPLGGEPFFQTARQIAELGRSDASGIGWGRDPTEDRSRLVLAQELLDPVYRPVRLAHFRYHFDVLDHFLGDQQAAWTAAVEVLTDLDTLTRQLNQRRYVTDLFFGARYQEITDLMMEAPQRNEAYGLLAAMDPSHLSTYDALVRGR